MATQTFPILPDDGLAFITSRAMHSYQMTNTLHGRGPRTVEALLELLDDRAICAILRVEPVTAKVENITEYCARQYLYGRDEAGPGIKVQDVHAFPLFVRNSIAWANWKDELLAEARVSAPEIEHA